MEVTLEQAYKEACVALGESAVRERLLTQQLQALTQQLETLAGQQETPPQAEPSPLEGARKNNSPVVSNMPTTAPVK